jgi:hypothetical protein
MPTAERLQADANHLIGFMHDGETINRVYPNNEWGETLRHYDSHIEFYGIAHLETKEESIHRDASKRHSEKEESWAQMHQNDPTLPSILYLESTYEAMKQALKFFQSPPESIRDCLVRLADGNHLHHEDLFVFLQTYAEFISATEVLNASDPSVDSMAAARGGWANNRKRWRLYAAERVHDIKQTDGLTIQEARDAFAAEIKTALSEKSFPKGWSKEDFEEFLGEPDKSGTANLRKAYGQNLTLPAIEKLLGLSSEKI